MGTVAIISNKNKPNNGSSNICCTMSPAVAKKKGSAKKSPAKKGSAKKAIKKKSPAKKGKSASKKKAASSPKKKRRSSPKKAGGPKRPKNAYMFFSNANRDAFMKKLGASPKDIAKIGKALGASWRSMSDADKKPYQAQADKDKARYNAKKK